jgi:hypothetical protein
LKQRLFGELIKDFDYKEANIKEEIIEQEKKNIEDFIMMGILRIIQWKSDYLFSRLN